MNGTWTWWRHQMETISAPLAFVREFTGDLLALCAGNSSVTGEFPSQRPVTRSFDVFFDLRLHKRLSKQLWCWWFETPSRLLWWYGRLSKHLLGQLAPGDCYGSLWQMTFGIINNELCRITIAKCQKCNLFILAIGIYKNDGKAIKIRAFQNLKIAKYMANRETEIAISWPITLLNLPAIIRAT